MTAFARSGSKPLALSFALLLGVAASIPTAHADPAPSLPTPDKTRESPPESKPAPDSPPAQLPTEAELAQVRALFEAGRNFILQGQYLEAIRSFEQAYAIVPRPNLVLSQATAHKNLYLVSGDVSHKVRAIKLFQEWFRLRGTAKLQSRNAQDTKLVAPI